MRRLSAALFCLTLCAAGPAAADSEPPSGARVGARLPTYGEAVTGVAQVEGGRLEDWRRYDLPIGEGKGCLAWDQPGVGRGMAAGALLGAAGAMAADASGWEAAGAAFIGAAAGGTLGAAFSEKSDCSVKRPVSPRRTAAPDARFIWVEPEADRSASVIPAE
ncbi:MAG TPA: hypothetical protein VEB20_03130 [Azospirillaceae bacterium]|nr:hypothetical protein [Azospirillaceae bacterium]